MRALEVAMDLDAAEEKMLRAIVQTAIAEAAAGRSFAGEFRHYVISATCLQVNEQGVAQIEARILFGGSTVVCLWWRSALVGPVAAWATFDAADAVRAH